MSKRVTCRDAFFYVLFLASAVLMVRSSSDAIPGWLRGTPGERWFSQFDAGNQNIHDIAVAIFGGFLIYFLVSWLPERDKRKRVRRNLRRQFDAFKGQCILVFFNAMGQSYDPACIENLRERRHFVEFFNGPFCPGQTRWHAVANGLQRDPVHIQSLIVELEILVGEVRFTLIAIDVKNRESDFFKDLANSLYRARNCSPEYDGVKLLLGSMWKLFTSWSVVEGYIEKDPVAYAINAM